MSKQYVNNERKTGKINMSIMNVIQEIYVTGNKNMSIMNVRLYKYVNNEGNTGNICQ